VNGSRRYRAGESLEDFCRACKTDRLHTVIAADGDGRPMRVVCGYCGSDHHYRGGPRVAADSPRTGVNPPPQAAGPPRPPAAAGGLAPVPRRERRASDGPLVSDRERTAPPMGTDSEPDLEMLLRRIIREEAGVTPVTPAERWRDGTLVLRPGKPGLQEKSWPIETFFHKIVMIRNRLRTLEQQVNASDLPDDAKVKLQTYVTGCYGSLTSFNLLFADEDDQFKGSAD
jgi:hypothetical protein